MMAHQPAAAAARSSSSSPCTAIHLARKEQASPCKPHLQQLGAPLRRQLSAAVPDSCRIRRHHTSSLLLVKCSALDNAREVSENPRRANPPPPKHLTIRAPTPDQVSSHTEKQMQDWILEIKNMFQNMNLGEITVSPYDTAWIAMVPSLDGLNKPQFPRCLTWIIDNQLLDGSWASDDKTFLPYDRLLSTLACIIALTTWNTGPESTRKGLEFIHKNINKLNEESNDVMPIAFEIAFPAMLDDAKHLGIHLPYDAPMVARIRKEGKQMLDRLPMDFIHSRPTTLLHSLEGLHRVIDWNKMLQFLTKDGCLLFSPASTACALKYTNDERCLQYLNMVLHAYNDAAPNVYPMDLFEKLWMVDRLERLGISRHFKKEIKQCMDYVYRYWTPQGIAWARDSNVFNVDDTSMGFRLLRLHGYPVSPDVFRGFKRGNSFFCFEGETSPTVTGMHNLYRASHLRFPNEPILEEVKDFTEAFLEEKRKENKLEDKWVISNGLKNEVSYTLDFPWHRSLPRIEARNFIGHYGVNDAWIAKTLYRMPYVNNNTFLKLAKADFHLCQSFHQKELAQVLKWNEDCKFDTLGFARQRSTECFFSVAATLFEPEYSFARIVWAISCVLTTMVDDFFDVGESLQEFTNFIEAVKSWDPIQAKGFSEEARIIFMGLYNSMDMINREAYLAQGRGIIHILKDTWVRYLNKIILESQWRLSNYCPTLEEYMSNGKYSVALEPIIQPTLFFLGERLPDEDLEHKDYTRVVDLIGTIGRLIDDTRDFESERSQGKWSCVTIYLKENPTVTMAEAIQHFQNQSEHAMTELVKECVTETRFSKHYKQAFLNMAKIFNLFYSKVDGYSSPNEMKEHVKDTLYMPIL